MNKIKQVIENLKHTQDVILAHPARNKAEARINEGILDQLEFDISRYEFQLKKLNQGAN